ncbi:MULTISPECIES: hypothetical protein [Bacillus]|uniref:hypothetical protein n=1 Tax=Bacillus TaxID=1386 RepID=UPI0002D23AE2|nr:MULTISPECIES: hypothetical protein [Bacillus]MEB9339165.1 hypothetical protein [Bacillus cereus]CCW08021.1 hypothetical protein EBGED10_47510 [Bacillus sp. GeD10]
MPDILYAEANFTEFNLRTFDKKIEENYIAERLHESFELLCAKCDKNLTKKEYEKGKLQYTKIGRKILGAGHKYGSAKLTGELIVIYSMEHKRCSKKL